MRRDAFYIIGMIYALPVFSETQRVAFGMVFLVIAGLRLIFDKED